MLFRVLSGECLKLKRTLALWMVLVSPLVMVLLQFAVSYKGAGVFLRDGKDAWPPMVRQTVEVWTLLMMPMFVTLETSLLAGLENTGKNWKSLPMFVTLETSLLAGLENTGKNWKSLL